MRRALLTLLLLVSAVTAAACGDDGGDTDDGVAPADAPFCDAYGELLSGPLADDATDATDPSVLEAAVDTTEGLLADLVDAAPAELHDAATQLTASYDETFAVLERYGYDLGRVQAEATPEEQTILDDFGDTAAGPDADDPFDTIQDWVADRCAPDVTIPPDLLDEPGTSTTSTTSP